MTRLIEGLREELQQQWREGKRILAETIFERHPSLLEDEPCALEFLYCEVLLREENGETPNLAEYVQRSPQFSTQLGLLFEVHLALETGEFLEPMTLDASVLAASRLGRLDTVTVQRPSAAPLPWPTVTGYEILGELGRGGMGVVYKALHLDLNRVVALKMILAASAADPAQLARFRSEGTAVARLRHSNIVQIHDVGEQDGRPFFALEFLEGGSLAQKVKATPQPAPPAAELLRILAHAAHTAHQKGIIHRDLKPANILFQAEEGGVENTERLKGPFSSLVPKIADFGLAKHLQGDSGQTTGGMVVGTPSFMAPEQIDPKLGEVGVAADVYGLGAIFYEVLTGRPPFLAETQLDTMRLVLNEEPVPLAQLLVNVPRDLETICLRCLHKEPRQRYASALALAEDLERFLADRPIHARSSVGERSWRWCRRNPVVASLASLTMLLLVVLATGSIVANSVLRTRLDRAEQAESDAERKLWSATLEKARSTRLSQRQGQRFAALEAVTEAVALARKLKLGPDAFAKMRTEAIACMALADMRLVKQWEGFPAGTRQLTFDDALELYARRDVRGTISVRRVADDSEVGLFPGPGEMHDLYVLRFSPDGKYFAATFAPGHILKVWRLGQPEPIFTAGENNHVAQIDFTPDSRYCVVSQADSTLVFVELSTRKTRRMSLPGPVCEYIAIHPNGRQMALTLHIAGRGIVQIRDVDSGAMLEPLTHPQRVECLAWHPRGEALAVCCDDLRIYLWNPATGKQIGLLEGHKSGGIKVAFSPNGELLASNDWEGIQRLWDFRSCQQVFSMPSGNPDQRFSRDGRHLAYSKGKNLGILEIEDGHEYRTIVADPGQGRRGYQETAVDPMGRVLAVGMNDGARLWELATGRQLAHLPTGFTPSVLFQHTGDFLTSGYRAGLQQWPIQHISKTEALYQIGPPVQLLSGATERVAQSSEGSTLVVNPANQGARVLELKPVLRVGPLLPHNRSVFNSLSPDGRWVATSTHGGAGVKIWSALNNQLELILPIEGSGPVAFSPDGRWLAMTTPGECIVWTVGDWNPKYRIPVLERCFAFTPNSQLLAVGTDRGIITLVEMETGRVIATLESPDQDVGTMSFSPDGTRLVITREFIHIWELHLIREQLAILGLDWDQPPFPPVEAIRNAAPIRLQVIEK